MMDYGLSGKYALVTGGSRGIGRATALQLAKQGCNVAICARDEGWLKKTYAEVKALGVTASYFVADVTDSLSLSHLCKKIDDDWAGVDILVNNAGDGDTQPDIRPENADDSIWENSINLNALAAVRLSRFFIPRMRKNGWGRIVSVASKQGKESGGKPWYTMAKAAEIAFMKTMASDFILARAGITFNTVAPGAVVTETGAWATFKKEDPVGFEAKVKSKFPMGRAGIPDEVASIITFLCSKHTNFLTGACIPIDGGESFSF